jgi:NDP-sugar pyrophosphorylase family protein
MPAHDLEHLHRLWLERGRQDQYIGTLVNEYINRGATVRAVRRGQRYVDVGTLHGYREAVNLLSRDDSQFDQQPLNVAA